MMYRIDFVPQNTAATPKLNLITAISARPKETTIILPNVTNVETTMVTTQTTKTAPDAATNTPFEPATVLCKSTRGATQPPATTETVKTASVCLNAPNQFPILMEQPEGYQRTPNNVYEMQATGGKVEPRGESGMGDNRKALVGTSRKWWKTLDNEMTRVGYTRWRNNQSVRSRKVGDEITIMATYTNNMTGLSSTTDKLICARKELGECHRIKDLRELQHMLGIHVEHDRMNGTLTLYQDGYPKTTQITTRPNFPFIIATLSHFSANPRKPHWLALTHAKNLRRQQRDDHYSRQLSRKRVHQAH
ncbi:hypothetical protein C0991_007655 [Blastosporella zonata]|nr:hypothetical protein C0991_007655 [Blastosporella zonata]